MVVQSVQLDELPLKQGQRSRGVSKDIRLGRRLAIGDGVAEKCDIAIVGTDLFTHPAMDNYSVFPTVIGMVDQSHPRARLQI